MGKSKLWNRSFITLACVNFFSILTFFLLTIKTTEYVLFKYGVPYNIAGSAVSIYIISALVMRLILGSHIDRWGVKRTLFFGCTLNAVASLLYLAPLDFAPFLSVRILHGASMALVTSSAAAAAAMIVPSDRRAEGIGYFTLSQALATGIGPYIGIMLTNVSGDYAPMFYFTAFTGLASFLTYFLVKFPDVLPTNSTNAEIADEEESASGVLTFKEKFTEIVGETLQLNVLPLCSSLLLTFVCYSGILGFLTVYASEKGLDSSASLYFVVYSVVMLISRPPVGRRVDCKGENSVMYHTFVIFALSFVVLAFANNGFMLLLSAALLGFGNGISQAVIQAIVAKLTPTSQLGRANSTLFVCMDVGSGIGPIIIGALILQTGYSHAFICLGGVAMLALVVYHFAHGCKISS